MGYFWFSPSRSDASKILFWSVHGIKAPNRENFAVCMTISTNWSLLMSRGVFLYCYKIVFGLFTLNMADFFLFSQFTDTRERAYKLYKSCSDCTVRMNLFANRVINARNNLPTSVNFTSLPAFSRTIKSVHFSIFLKCNNCWSKGQLLHVVFVFLSLAVRLTHIATHCFIVPVILCKWMNKWMNERMNDERQNYWLDLKN